MEARKEQQKNWFIRHKVWTAIIILFAIGLIQTLFSGKSTSTNDQTDVTPTQQVTKAPVKKWNIVITSDIVKKVAPTTYRYFFNIANNDTEDFKGDISLQIYNGHSDPQPLIFGGGSETVSIKAGLNTSTYVDDSHAPTQVDGIDGATTFGYTASVGDNTVASGKGDIGQYEDDLQQ